MNNKILVTYVSTHGSTREVAEFITNVLRENGKEVDLQPMRTVLTLEGYDGVVLGAPLYMFHLHASAKKFLKRHQNALSGSLPAAVFAGGPFGQTEEKTWQEVRTNLEKELAKFPWFQPVSVEVVGGKFDPSKLRFPYSLIPAMKNQPASDLRDWEAIRTWAISLLSRFSVSSTI
jgi:menaquinone-dependent protoporphyrinogen oxidase